MLIRFCVNYVTRTTTNYNHHYSRQNGHNSKHLIKRKKAQICIPYLRPNCKSIIRIKPIRLLLPFRWHQQHNPHPQIRNRINSENQTYSHLNRQ
jgi:hypothetical protein